MVAGCIRLEQLMKFRMIILGVISGMCYGAGTGQAAESKTHAEDESFKVVADQFADIQVLRYQAPGFDQLTLQQKKLAYFLTEAGLAGRDIFYDQKYRHNLLVRKTIEGILRSYKGNKQGEDYQKFLVYAKRVFFGNGIHHHYSNIKLDPGFSVSFFRELLSNSEASKLPLEGKSVDELTRFLEPILAGWLRKAIEVAENDTQKQHLAELIRYYETGDLEAFNQHCIKWVAETSARIDVVNGFIEVYQDPMQKKGSFESVVSMKDMEATKRIAAISREAQWFEDHSPIADAHKKKDVVGISAKVIAVLGEVGDSAPVTPVGINLPNADWIREKYGSKSVMAGNIMAAYNYVKARSPATEEFAATPEVAARIKKHGALASDLHVDMHEVIGHASGKINPGVATPDKTLKSYAGTLEEARADLVALFFAMDPKLVAIGVMPSPEVGKAEYDSYIMGGLMTQLYRVKPGENLEEAHMRNRQLVSAWVLEHGKQDYVIERVTRDGKTYFKINDYDKLRGLFGQLLREIQRLKSEGDYEAAKSLVETYGVTVDQPLLAEVHKRYEPLKIAPYQGFIQPRLVPVKNGGEIMDVKIEYPEEFIGQMLEYADKYSFLPVRN